MYAVPVSYDRKEKAQRRKLTLILSILVILLCVAIPLVIILANRSDSSSKYEEPLYHDVELVYKDEKEATATTIVYEQVEPEANPELYEDSCWNGCILEKYHTGACKYATVLPSDWTTSTATIIDATSLNAYATSQ